MITQAQPPVRSTMGGLQMIRGAESSGVGTGPAELSAAGKDQGCPCFMSQEEHPILGFSNLEWLKGRVGEEAAKTHSVSHSGWL